MKKESLNAPGENRPWATILALRNNPLGYMERIASTYGDIAHLRVGPYKLVFINHPDLVHEVLVAKDASFIKGRALDQTRDVFGQGLLTSEGEFHKRQRRLIQPAFHRRRIEGYAAAMATDAAAAAARWQDGETVDISREMMRLTLRIVARTLFSVDVEEGAAREVGRALDALVDAFSVVAVLGTLFRKLPLPSIRRANKARETLDALIYRMIAERRRAGGGGEDLLSLLLAARDEDGSAMDDRQVRDEAMTLFLAGHETTANALAWSWYLLAGHPEAEARFHAEVDAVLGDRLPGAADLPSLPVTRQVFAEAMRLYPPAWAISRRSIEPVTVGGYPLPEGTGVLASQWVLHRDPRFFPDPSAFRPERWTEDFEAALPKLAYFPFGGGPRICIGMGFAWMEGILLLATLGRRWKMRLVPGQRVEPHPRITLRPKNGVRVTLERR
ncbi:MAG TPA: cytochrome P450, partial [Thermoanaerobaculia bacterium]|nr:cytochrome P450 [Thermoanaerobaculia bacterium]